MRTLTWSFLVLVVSSVIVLAGENDKQVPIAVLNNGEFIDVIGRTQEVRVAVFISTGGVEEVSVLIEKKDSLHGKAQWENGYSFRLVYASDDVPRAQKWAVETKAKNLKVADKSLSPNGDEYRFRFFSDGQSWGIAMKPFGVESKHTIRLKDEQAAEFCQILQDIQTPIKRQRAIERGKKAFARTQQAATEQPNVGDGLKY